MASIVDVARQAGVSPATASRVLSGSSHAVSQATRARVHAVAEELDFVPNALARGLLKSRAPIVGVIVHDITDPYFGEIVRGVEDAAEASGYLVITCSSDRSAEREDSYVRLLRSMRAAAVLFAGSGIRASGFEDQMARHLVAMERYGAAVVHLSPGHRGAAQVGVDNAGAMAAIVRGLIALGHRRIGYLSGPEWLYVASDRDRGYRDALADAGIAPDPRIVISTSFDIAGGMSGIDRLLAVERPEREQIVGARDCRHARLDRLSELGVSVPGDISVSGFDDIPGASRTAPSLSTVRVPLRELGSMGLEHALKTLAGRRPHRRLLPYEVVLRGSTSAPRARIERTATTAAPQEVAAR